MLSSKWVPFICLYYFCVLTCHSLWVSQEASAPCLPILFLCPDLSPSWCSLVCKCPLLHSFCFHPLTCPFLYALQFVSVPSPLCLFLCLNLSYHLCLSESKSSLLFAFSLYSHLFHSLFCRPSSINWAHLLPMYFYSLLFFIFCFSNTFLATPPLNI